MKASALDFVSVPRILERIRQKEESENASKETKKD